mmetsp:Transcript_24461/g.48803  ORF Transcript_24461/g.48803 Transcript_24461/m.48803 type:complete len:177 (+) Transcript_24461:109-639(+)
MIKFPTRSATAYTGVSLACVTFFSVVIWPWFVRRRHLSDDEESSQQQQPSHPLEVVASRGREKKKKKRKTRGQTQVSSSSPGPREGAVPVWATHEVVRLSNAHASFEVLVDRREQRRCVVTLAKEAEPYSYLRCDANASQGLGAASFFFRGRQGQRLHMGHRPRRLQWSQRNSPSS